jgi:hypothetical protein
MQERERKIGNFMALLIFYGLFCVVKNAKMHYGIVKSRKREREMNWWKIYLCEMHILLHQVGYLSSDFIMRCALQTFSHHIVISSRFSSAALISTEKSSNPMLLFAARIALILLCFVGVENLTSVKKKISFRVGILVSRPFNC